MENLENFYGENLFIFTNYSCSCFEDTVHQSPNESPIYTYKIYSDTSKPIKLAYAAKRGLVRIAKNGTIECENLLGIFIGLANAKRNKIEKFFAENGFIFPLPADEFEAIPYEKIMLLINRLKITVELLSELGKIHTDYFKLLELICNLIFYQPFSFQTKNMESAYTSCLHSFLDLLEKGNNMTESIQRRNEISREEEVFEIEDCTQTTPYEFSIEEYNTIKDKYSSYPPDYQSIVTLFVNYNVKQEERCAIDVLFHYFHDYQSGNAVGELSDKMIENIRKFAKMVIGEEINHNLKGITPMYKIETMEPSWRVDSLLSAMYLSLFYLKPDMQLYRPCANPRCNNYFLVKTTSSRNKYCCRKCADNVTQTRYRKNKKNESSALN